MLVKKYWWKSRISFLRTNEHLVEIDFSRCALDVQSLLEQMCNMTNYATLIKNNKTFKQKQVKGRKASSQFR